MALKVIIHPGGEERLVCGAASFSVYEALEGVCFLSTRTAAWEAFQEAGGYPPFYSGGK